MYPVGNTLYIFKYHIAAFMTCIFLWKYQTFSKRLVLSKIRISDISLSYSKTGTLCLLTCTNLHSYTAKTPFLKIIYTWKKTTKLFYFLTRFELPRSLSQVQAKKILSHIKQTIITIIKSQFVIFPFVRSKQ